jgi:hypothetical protein
MPNFKGSGGAWRNTKPEPAECTQVRTGQFSIYIEDTFLYVRRFLVDISVGIGRKGGPRPGMVNQRLCPCLKG